MLIGVLFGIAACMIWGCVYVAPLILPDYSPVHIAMMRYLVFGMLAAGLAVPEWRELKFYSTADWRRALALGIVGNIFYYWLLAEACQRAGAPIAGAFTALIPIMVGVIGNMRAGESAVPWRRIVPPLCLSFAGMVCLNWTEFIYLVGDGRVTSGNFWLGVGFAFFSSLVWTWYPLSNAEWLLSHPGKSPKTWSTAQGLALLPCAAVGMALLAGDGTRLPPALGGQMIIFETIFAVTYAHLWRSEWPTPLMLVGLGLLLMGVTASLKVFRRPRRTASGTT